MPVFRLGILYGKVNFVTLPSDIHSYEHMIVNVATSLLSPPYSLASILASPHFISPSTDIKLKHGILGLLKHISQYSKLSPVIPTSLAEVGILERISTSGIWDEKSDAMADVIQLSAIGVAKHMCHASRTCSIVQNVGLVLTKILLPSGPYICIGSSQRQR